MNTLAKIEALEAKLATTAAGRPGVVDALTGRIAKAEAHVATFRDAPAADGLNKALEAVSTVTAGKALLANFGDAKSWTERVQSEWTRTHHAELCQLIEALINERAAHRQAFRDAAGIELGRLTTAIVKADGDNAPDAELERMNGQLAEIEDSLANREANLHTATDALRSFKTAVERPDGYMPLYRMWQNARDAAASVDFEPAPAEPLALESNLRT